MGLYRRGSMGAEVLKIQQKLKQEGMYHGDLDGIFGGGTESAVRAFQRRDGLNPVDGIVGPETWKRLFPDKPIIPNPEVTTKSLEYRVLALTGSFETGQPIPECFAGLTGDFDKQGISFGALQWNFGQGSLPPLLKDMATHHAGILKEIFDNYYPEFLEVIESDRDEQMDWARSIQDARYRLDEPWRGMFKTLGRNQEFQNIQVKYARNIYNVAIQWCKDYGLKTEQAVALMYDIRVQNGSISQAVKNQILRDFGNVNPDNEAARLIIVAERRAEAANPRWVEDVRKRKLTIATGKGKVHGRYYDLEKDYGISLKAFS